MKRWILKGVLAFLPGAYLLGFLSGLLGKASQQITSEQVISKQALPEQVLSEQVPLKQVLDQKEWINHSSQTSQRYFYHQHYPTQNSFNRHSSDLDVINPFAIAELSPSQSSPNSTSSPLRPAALPLTLGEDSVRRYGRVAIDAGIPPELFPDAVKVYRKVASDQGFSPDELATGLTFFLYINYAIATGQSEETLDMTTIYNQVRSSLSENPELQAAHRNDAEGFGALSVMYILSTSQAEEKRDQPQQQRLRQAAQNSLELLLGVQWSQVRFTRTGFVIQ